MARNIRRKRNFLKNRVVADRSKEKQKKDKKPVPPAVRERERAIKRQQPWVLERYLSRLRNPVARFLTEFLRVVREQAYAPRPEMQREKKPEKKLQVPPVVVRVHPSKRESEFEKASKNKEHHQSESKDLHKSLQRYHAAQNKVMSHRVDSRTQKMNGQHRTRAMVHSKTQNGKRIG
jgi:hypothetical protein